MEKYSQNNDLLLRQLQDEEHILMRDIGAHMTQMDKTAEEEQKIANAESRLGQVRSKIQEIMLKDKNSN